MNLIKRGLIEKIFGGVGKPKYCSDNYTIKFIKSILKIIISKSYYISNFNHWINSWSCCIFIRITYCITSNCCFMSFTAFSSIITIFNIFFALSQAPPPAVILIATNSPVIITPNKQSP